MDAVYRSVKFAQRYSDGYGKARQCAGLFCAKERIREKEKVFGFAVWGCMANFRC